MKYSHFGLLIFLAAAHVHANDLRVCRANTNLNSDQRFSHEIITSDDGDFKVVNDAQTGLQWSFCFVGQTLSADQKTCEGEPHIPFDDTPIRKYYPDVRGAVMAALATEVQRLDATKKSWRLPNVHELLSIYNDHCVPAHNPAFSVAFGLTAEEIDALASIRIDWGAPEAEQVATGIEQRKGNTFKNVRVTTDTAVPGEYMYFYHVNFTGQTSPVSSYNREPGVLRLVREQP